MCRDRNLMLGFLRAATGVHLPRAAAARGVCHA